MMKLLLEGHSIDDLRAKVATAAASLGVPQPGYGISALGVMGLPPAPNEATQSHWERARQVGYSQGYNAGFGDACDRAWMDPAAIAAAEPDFVEPERTPAATIALAESHERRAQELRKALAARPEGCRDYLPADVVQQQVNPGPWYPPPADVAQPETASQVGPGPDFEEIAEANRKTAVAVGQARQEYYAEREGKLGASVSSPEMVARAIAKSGRPLPGE